METKILTFLGVCLRADGKEKWDRPGWASSSLQGSGPVSKQSLHRQTPGQAPVHRSKRGRMGETGDGENGWNGMGWQSDRKWVAIGMDWTGLSLN